MRLTILPALVVTCALSALATPHAHDSAPRHVKKSVWSRRSGRGYPHRRQEGSQGTASLLPPVAFVPESGTSIVLTTVVPESSSTPESSPAVSTSSASEAAATSTSETSSAPTSASTEETSTTPATSSSPEATVSVPAATSVEQSPTPTPEVAQPTPESVAVSSTETTSSSALASESTPLVNIPLVSDVVPAVSNVLAPETTPTPSESVAAPSESVVAPSETVAAPSESISIPAESTSASPESTPAPVESSSFVAESTPAITDILPTETPVLPLPSFSAQPSVSPDLSSPPPEPSTPPQSSFSPEPSTPPQSSFSPEPSTPPQSSFSPEPSFPPESSSAPESSFAPESSLPPSSVFPEPSQSPSGSSALPSASASASAPADPDLSDIFPQGSSSVSAASSQSRTASATPTTTEMIQSEFAYLSAPSLVQASVATPTVTGTEPDAVPDSQTGTRASGTTAPRPSVTVPAGLPAVIYPGLGLNPKDKDLDGFRLGTLMFSLRLPWTLVAQNTESAGQIFAYSPILLSNALQISSSEVLPYAVQAWIPEDYNNDPNTIRTVLQVYIPNENFDELANMLRTRQSRLYTSSSGIAAQLAENLEPTFPLASSADNAGENNAGGSSTTMADNRRRDAIIGVCVSLGGVALIAVIWWAWRAAKHKREAAHKRLSGPADSAAVVSSMAERRGSFFFAEDSLRGYATATPGRDEDMYTHHAPSHRRAPIQAGAISAPVMQNSSMGHW